MFIAGTATRRDCFHLSILEDTTAEDDEYLFLDLYLEETLFGIQEETRIILNSTRVTIQDNIGMYIRSPWYMHMHACECQTLSLGVGTTGRP